MSDEKRVPIRCWNCGRTYELLREFRKKPILLVACPFCSKEGQVRLKPFRTSVVEMKAGDDAFTLDQLQLPDVLPSEPRTDDEEKA